MKTSTDKTQRNCHICGSEEGKPRPIGGYIVELKTIKNYKGEANHLCQSCYYYQLEALNYNSKKKIMNRSMKEKIKRLTERLFISLVVIGSLSSIVLAQPGLPSAPSQAPIDGGLGLLAAVGGAYAYKKLKDRNSSTSE